MNVHGWTKTNYIVPQPLDTTGFSQRIGQREKNKMSDLMQFNIHTHANIIHFALKFR